MFKKLFQSAVFSLLSLGLMVSGVQASAKMEVALGEQVVLQVEDRFQFGNQVEWIVKKEGEVFNVQNNPSFNYTFLEQGEYEVIVEVKENNDQIYSTTIFVLAGNRFSGAGQDGSSGGGLSGGTGGPVLLVYQTLPLQDANGEVTLLGDGHFAVDIQAIDPRILEYRVDYNVFEDSDGDGVANNDIDNANERCFLLGGICHTTYTADQSDRITAQITLVSRTGEKIQDEINIRFDEPPSGEGDLVAQLQVLPLPNQNTQMVDLYKQTHQVAFYAKKSQGNISEYRIDKNIFEDSNGDGNPSNDIDNLNHDSFRSGDVWVTDYEKTDEQIIASLTVVSAEGRGSRVERGIVFTDAPVVDVSGSDEEASDTSIQLKADKPFVLKGDPVNFSVENLARPLADYSFEWDFEGDETFDKEVEGDNTVSHIYEEAGIFRPTVNITDVDGNTGQFTLDFLIQEPEVTKADFEFVVQENTVSFTNLSETSMQLGDQNLDYTWSFGETDEASYEAQKDQTKVQNPVYTYAQPGTYQVTLTVTDANQIEESKTLEVVIDGVADAQSGQAQEENDGEGGSLILKILGILLYILLIVFILLLCFVGGLMAYIKAQKPDLSFGEVVDQMKLKLLSWLGVGDMIEADHATPAQAEEVEAELMQEASETAEESASEDQSESPSTDDSEQELSTSEPTPKPIRLDETPIEKPKDETDGIEAAHPGTGPMPDWLKPKTDTSPAQDTEVIDGEVEEDEDESQSTPAETPTPSQVTEVQPTPSTPTSAPSEPSSDTQGDSGSDDQPLDKNDGPVPDWLKGK